MRASTPPHTPPSEDLPVAPLTWLFTVAGGLGLVSVVVPHDPEIHVGAVVAISIASLLTAAGVRAAGGRVGRVGLTALLGVGIAYISLAIVATAGVPNATATLYTWVCLYAFYALPWRPAWVLLALIALQYAVVIAVDPPPFPAVAHWTTTVGTLAGAGTLVGLMKRRLDAMITRLAEVARTDALTELLNRRALREAIDRELARSERNGRALAVVLLDVDRFKSVNDRLGHAVGDEVLVQVAAVLRAEARVTDVVARSGGEEFAVLLPETGAAQAVAIAERLRSALSRRVSRPGVVLTASFGVAAWPHHGTEADRLLHNADRALYAAKRSGRDRVVCFDPVTTAELLDERRSPARAEALLLLAESLDLRDASTAEHSRTVAEYAAAIAAHLGLAPADVERVRLAAALHDIGKLSMPDAILHKPSGLDDAEWEVVRRHPELGARLLEGAGLDDLAAWVRCHHERPDGRGYPLGLRGDAVPLEARILGVADAYEAMIADRPYRRGRPHDAAVAELRAHAGTQFDPDVVDALVAVHASVAAPDVRSPPRGL
jgi:diguanylate cyclase (GGDEF)-like protein/putative nucleotidyltransferase with HDIG domain